MRKIVSKFLENRISLVELNQEFDASFNENSSEESFNLEFSKFLSFYNSVFYDKTRYVTCFNSNEIRVKFDDLKSIIYLYLYSCSHSLIYHKSLIQDFLYTYQITINRCEYAENYDKYQESKNDFSILLEQFNIRRNFFVDFINELFVFYKSLFSFGLENDIFIDGETIYKVFNNLSFGNKDYKELIEMFIEKKNNLYNIVFFDLEKKKHIDTYMEYINDSLEHFGGYNYAKELFVELELDDCLDESLRNRIINNYVMIVNNLVNTLKDKQSSFIKGLSDIENAKKEILYLLKRIERFNDIQKKKLNELLTRLLRIKRFIISDDEYVNAEMHESKFEQKIPSEEVDKYRKALLENKLRIYSASSVKFVNEMGTALEMYANYPMQSLVSRYTIDSKREIYALGIEDRKKVKSDNFKKYFDCIGSDYTKTHPKLLNKLHENYYEEMLRYMSTTFQLHQNLLLSMLYEEEFNSMIFELKELVGYNFENYYAMIASNILAIEVNVIKILEKNNLPVVDDGFDNLNELFEFYKGDIDKVNGLMYLNYILYEKSGLNLRNNVMHGTLFNENLNIPLIVSFSGLIFISWLGRWNENE